MTALIQAIENAAVLQAAAALFATGNFSSSEAVDAATAILQEVKQR